VPVRWPPEVFPATEYLSVPFPMPLGPESIAIHGALLVALHLHQNEADTLTELTPPAAPGAALVAPIPNVQLEGGRLAFNAAADRSVWGSLKSPDTSRPGVLSFPLMPGYHSG